MYLEFVQKKKQTYFAEFVLKSGEHVLGEFSLSGQLGDREGLITGHAGADKIMMSAASEDDGAEKKAFRTYGIWRNDVAVGKIRQRESEGSLFHKYYYLELELPEASFSLYSIGLGHEGAVFPLYIGDRQIAQLEKDCIMFNDLHSFRIYCASEEDGAIAAMFCLFMYVNGGYKPGKKSLRFKSSVLGLTTNKELLDKYDPDFLSNL